MENQRSRSFVFTINNPEKEDIDIFSQDKFKKQVRYYIYGNEIGEKGTPHIQGYIYFHNQKTFKQVKKHFPRAHIEKSHGTVEENIAYCSKDEKFNEYGEKPQIGKRNDLIGIKEKVLNNIPVREIIPDIQNYQQLKFMESLIKYQPTPKPCKKQILWYYGAPGTGKTRKAIEGNPDYYISMKDLKWWDGYIGQDTVIIDDFRKDFCTFHELLRILDRYPYRINTKGSSLYLQAKKIIITSCYRPEEVYDTREDIQQLLRRIDEVVEFKYNKITALLEN